MRQETSLLHTERAVAAIEALDLEPIKFKISSPEDGYGWSRAHVERIALAYRRFLTLLARHPQARLAPTRDIDRFWHAHILDTRKYALDCDAIFGGFLHHYPYLGMLGDEDRLAAAADALAALYEREFGEPLPCNVGAGGVAGADAATAWCGVEADRRAAWCGAEGGDRAAAWCGAEGGDRAAAWCGVEPRDAKRPSH